MAVQDLINDLLFGFNRMLINQKLLIAEDYPTIKFRNKQQ